MTVDHSVCMRVPDGVQAVVADLLLAVPLTPRVQLVRRKPLPNGDARARGGTIWADKAHDELIRPVVVDGEAHIRLVLTVQAFVFTQSHKMKLEGKIMHACRVSTVTSSEGEGVEDGRCVYVHLGCQGCGGRHRVEE